MVEKSLKRFERRNSAGRLVVAYDTVDPTVPYFRKTLGEWRDEDNGPWSDLAPDLPDWVAVGDDPTWLLDYLLADGPVRATLLELGVSKWQWEAGRKSDRRAVARALRAVQLLNETVQAVLTSSDRRIRRTGVTALKEFAGRVEIDAKLKSRKGAAGFRKRRELTDRAAGLVDLVEKLLASAKEYAKRQEWNAFGNAAWVGTVVDDLNFIATMRSLPYRVRCTPADVRRISGRGNPRAVARDVVERTFRGDVERESLERGFRDEPKKKQSDV